MRAPCRPSPLKIWWTAARPRTLPLAMTPVILGTALAWAEGAPHAWLPALAALLCSLLIQAGTNIHNDVSDFEKGNDLPDRVGPLRITAAGWAPPATVRRVAVMVFTAAFVLGIYLANVGGWPIVAVGLASLGAGWLYSGGPRPISHTPLGEICVFVFFGLVAVGGSHWLQAGSLSLASFLGGCAIGAPAAAVLMVNNYRDMVGDRRAGRLTLASLLGPRASRQFYVLLLLLPFAVPPLLARTGHPWSLLAFLALPACLSLCARMGRSQPGPAMNEVLAGTARASLLLGILLSAGVSIA